MSLQVGFKCRKQIYCYSPFSSIIYFDCLSTSLTETSFAFSFIWVPLLAIWTGFLHSNSLFALKVTIYICWISKLAIRDMTFWNKKKGFGTVMREKVFKTVLKTEVFGNVLKGERFQNCSKKESLQNRFERENVSNWFERESSQQCFELKRKFLKLF